MWHIGRVWHFEPATQIMPEADFLFVAGVKQRETGVAADILRRVTCASDVIFHQVAVQRRVRMIQRHQQFRLFFVETIQCQVE